jgi:mono/diheme cytochrome c family protein
MIPSRVKQLLATLLLLLPACQQQMASQPSHRPDEPSTFFPDGRASRPLVAGTVARGHLRNDLHLFAARRAPEPPEGVQSATLIANAGANPLGAAAAALDQQNGANLVDTFPFPITAEILTHGRNRFMIYCVVCHDPLGTGRGMIVERGYTPPPTYHIPRLRRAPVGHFYEVITKGYGSMPSYNDQVPPRDRWAIIAYIRALQRSQHFPSAELPADMRQEWLAQAGGAP